MIQYIVVPVKGKMQIFNNNFEFSFMWLYRGIRAEEESTKNSLEQEKYFEFMNYNFKL